MRYLFSYRVNLGSAYFALWSFIIGHMLFLLVLATKSEMLIVAGITFMVFLIVLTPISMLILLVNMLLNLKDIRQHLTAIFMVLLNIPFAILYVNFITIL